jgi:hypothetical protein
MKMMTDRIKEIKIAPGPIRVVIFLGILLNPRPRIRNPKRGNKGISVTRSFISFDISYLPP